MTPKPPHLPKDPDLSQFVLEETAHDHARAKLHVCETHRHRGVAWSGLGPDPWRPRTPARLEADAAARWKALRDWRTSRVGCFFTAVARAQRAAAAAHFAGEAARAAVGRDFEAEHERCAAAARNMEMEGRALLAAARQARRALARHGGGSN